MSAAHDPREGGIITPPPGKRIVMFADGRTTEHGTPFWLIDKPDQNDREAK